nr:hypothetical protein [Lachnotalea sp. AF33-28]
MTHIEVKVEEETVWLTIDQMSELFGKARSTINEHILNVFSEGELLKSESVEKSEIPIFLQNLRIIIILML